MAPSDLSCSCGSKVDSFSECKGPPNLLQDIERVLRQTQMKWKVSCGSPFHSAESGALCSFTSAFLKDHPS